MGNLINCSDPSTKRELLIQEEVIDTYNIDKVFHDIIEKRDSDKLEIKENSNVLYKNFRVKSCDRAKVNEFYHNQNINLGNEKSIYSKGHNFEDFYFKPEISNIKFIDKALMKRMYINDSDIDVISSYTFKKLSTKYKFEIKVELFNYELTKDKVDLGVYANINLYNTIEHLISLNEILKNIIELNSESNCFYVKLHLQGKPKWILIDNYFPFDGTEHAFFKPSVEFLWILLIEKAYAKINRSYSNCFRDMASDHFSVLSNAPLKKIDHTYLSPIKVWNYIIKSLKLNFTIFSEFDTYILEHYNKEYFYSYYIIGAFLYKSKKYLKLNIPNLKNQDLLCKITKYFQDPNVPKEIITNKNVIISDDNNKFIFIAEFEHFLKTFYKTFVLLYHENYIYENKKFLVKDKSYFVCKLNLKNDTNMVLSLILKLSKYFTKIKNFEVPISRVILCKANCFSNIENESKFRNSFRDTQKEPTLEFIDSTYGREDKHILELFLGKGVYILFFKVLTEFQISAVVSTYSDNPIEIEEVFSEEEKDILFNIKIKNFILLNSIYESYLKKNIEKEENFDKEFSLKSSLFNQNFGFSVLKISNNSKDKLLCIKLLFEIFGMHLISHENSKNTLRLISNSTNENSKSLTEYINIYPNTSEIIIFEWEKTFNYVDIYIYPKIKIKSMYYFPHYYEDFTKIERKKLMDKIFYCEIPYKNGIYIIFFNDFSNNYKIMAEFKNINNILIDLPKCKGNVVTLEIKRFSNNYILLKVINNEEVKYNVDFHIQRI